MSERKRRYKNSLFTNREIEVWKLYKELGTQPLVAKKLNVYNSAVSQHINSVRQKIEKCLNTISVAIEENIIDNDILIEKLFPHHFKKLKRIAIYKTGGSVYHLILELINKEIEKESYL